MGALLVVFVVALRSSLPAQSPPLTLAAAVDEAVQNNPTLIAFRAELDVLRAQRQQERFLNPPMLETQVWQWPINSLNPADAEMFMFMIAQELPWSGKRELREAAAATRVGAAEADVSAKARAVVADVKRTYAELYVSREAIKIAQENLGLLRQLAEASQAKYATGRIAQTDVLKIVVEISRTHEELITLGERAQMAEAKFATLLARSPDVPIGPLAQPVRRPAVPAAADLQRLALERQPELQAARAAIEAAEAELRIVSAERKPDFFLKGGYMLMPNDRDAWTASIAVNWPTAPWSRGRLDARSAEANGRIATARAQLAAAENAIKLMVQESWIRTRAAAARAALLETTVLPQAEQSLEVARAAYQTDRVDFMALIDDSRIRVRARLDYLEALAALEQAHADLERAVGIDQKGHGS
jgi:outer membrane protein TolC